MTAKIGIIDIMSVLHSRLWKDRRERFASLTFDDYRQAMLTSGLISTYATIKAKWAMMGGASDFFGIQANRNLLAVDLNAVRCELYSRGIISENPADASRVCVCVCDQEAAQ